MCIGNAHLKTEKKIRIKNVINTEISDDFFGCGYGL